MNLLEINLDKLKSILGTDLERGLTGEQVLRSRREFGENVFHEKPNTAVSLLKKIFGDVMMIAYLITGLFDYLQNQNLISLICVFFVAALYTAFVFGAYLYGKQVEKRVEKYSRSRLHVRRNGRVVSVNKSELVPGDILLLEKGDVMPCDGIILSCRELKILEASVTGQRVPVLKRSHEQVQSDEKYPYFECILFSGSVVLQGAARVFVCNTGRDIFDCENFTVSRQTGTIPRIYRVAMELKKQILLIWVLACFLIFAWGVFRGQDVFNIFYFSVAMVIAAFPGSIEHFCDLSVSYMTDRLFREGVVLRNPGAIDLLCDANCIFVNSADYLFYAKPMAGCYFVGEREYDFRVDHVPAKPLLEDLLLSQTSSAYLRAAGHSEDRKIEAALLTAGARAGLQKRDLDRKYMHIRRADPDPYRKFSCTLVLKDGSYRLVMRGEPNQVLAACSSYREDGVDLPLTGGAAILIRGTFRRAAALCERMIAVAEVTLSSPPEGDIALACHDLVYLGVFGLSTPVSAAAAKEVNSCEKSGIETYLLTDDYPETVEALAKSVSIIKENDYQYALKYTTYQRMDRGVFVADVEKYKAYCLFPPEEKQNVVRYHKDNGDITVSLTGGMADILPQMESDVSVVSADEKAAAVRLNADLLLREKKFERIPLCINWARIQYQNVVHIMQFVLLLQVSLCFAVFLSLTLTGETLFRLPAMVIAGLGAALPCTFNLYHRSPGSTLAHNIGVLKDRIYSLQVLIIMPTVAGLVGAISITLSRQIALFSSGSADAAAGAGLLTMIFSAYFASLSMKTENGLFRDLREVGKSGLYTLSAVLITGIVTVFSPLAALYHPTYWENGSGLTFATTTLALLLSLLPMGVMELMKILKKEDPVRSRAPKDAAGEDGSERRKSK